MYLFILTAPKRVAQPRCCRVHERSSYIQVSRSSYKILYTCIYNEHVCIINSVDNVTYDDFQTYRDGHPPALKRISFVINPGEKVNILVT